MEEDRGETGEGGEEGGGTQRLRLAMGRFLRLLQVCCCSMHSQSVLDVASVCEWTAITRQLIDGAERTEATGNQFILNMHLEIKLGQ